MTFGRVAALGSLAFFLNVSPTTGQDVPKLTFLYPPPSGAIFDRSCRSVTAEGAAPELVAETVRRREEFQQHWNRDGPIYLTTAFKEIRLAFPFREMQPTLTVCGHTMSTPLMINVSRFLSGANDPAPQEDFLETVFHELMHHYVAPVLATSALRRKSADEPPSVQAHLHVMALEHVVLTRLGKVDALRRLARLYESDPPPGHYKRAWDLVTTHGPEAFIEELKAVAARRVQGAPQ